MRDGLIKMMDDFFGLQDMQLSKEELVNCNVFFRDMTCPYDEGLVPRSMPRHVRILRRVCWVPSHQLEAGNEQEWCIEGLDLFDWALLLQCPKLMLAAAKLWELTNQYTQPGTTGKEGKDEESARLAEQLLTTVSQPWWMTKTEQLVDAFDAQIQFDQR
eukprot:gene44059-51007_t